MMKIILLQRVETLGQMGDVVSVRPGYARNYLLPQRMALRASRDNLARFEEQRAQMEADNLAKCREAEVMAERMLGLSVILVRAASASAQLYGSVTAGDIAQAVTEAGFSINRTQVLIDRPIKTLGIFEYRIRLHPEVITPISVNVALTVEEAEAQAARVARGEPAVLTAAAIDSQEAARETRRQAQAIAAAAAEREADEIALETPQDFSDTRA